MADGVMVYDNQFRLVTANPASMRMFGLPVEAGQELAAALADMTILEWSAVVSDEPIMRFWGGGFKAYDVYNSGYWQPSRSCSVRATSSSLTSGQPNGPIGLGMSPS